MYTRLLQLPGDHSFFLFGPRGVGKTTLLRETLPSQSTFTMNLLDSDIEMRLLRRPKEFSEILAGLPKNIRWVFIDEVQKLPFLLDEVHRSIESDAPYRFALTGSSARKLKRGQANLLAGRAFTYSLSPLTSREPGDDFDLSDALAFGTLPKVLTLNEDEKKQFLRSYSKTYLQEEIQSEGVVRQLPAFRQFLFVAGVSNGQIISWSNIAQDVGVSAQTIRSYFAILEDTLIGLLLPAFHLSLRKRQRKHPKFYMFDPGVTRALAGTLTIPLLVGTTEYGRAFEHFWILELMRMSEYLNSDYRFSYFATNDIEIDLVIERPDAPLLFVEIKSSETVKDSAVRPLSSLIEEDNNREGIIISREPRKRKVGRVLICPWEEAIQEIFHS